MEASIIGSLILIFAQLHQPAAALDDYSQGICDGRSLQQNLNLHRNAPSRPKNDFPTVAMSRTISHSMQYLQPELIRSNGYPAEEHWTTTPDGYILALHRSNNQTAKPPTSPQDPTWVDEQGLGRSSSRHPCSTWTAVQFCRLGRLHAKQGTW